MTEIAVVTADFELQLVVPGGPPLPVLAGLRYDRLDPWAVHLTFHTSGNEDSDVVWVFGRQLLMDGITGPAGEGDVRVWPALHGQERVVNLAMSSPSGSALFEIDRDDLIQFLQQTYLVVPTGCESDNVDLDAALDAILGR